eukprot:NODE_86_length_22075_cov_1.190253.p10 type:complete len:297 gc:universal NODE_86_length_22075_cov_1.190253:20313-19423(-)
MEIKEKNRKIVNRTTKTSAKLTVFPEASVNQPKYDIVAPETEEREGNDNPPDFLLNLDRRQLPRCTALCVGNGYNFELLQVYLHSYGKEFKKIDECIFCKWEPKGSFHSEIFFFDYGVLVIWGLSREEEGAIVQTFKPFCSEPVDKLNVEIEELLYHYNTNYQPRIYNDVITLKSEENWMAKMTISHCIAQSSKLAYFENLIDTTIEQTKEIPKLMAKSGTVPLSRKEVNMKIGKLFGMRINVNLVSNVLDTPDIFWSEPYMEPLYQATRGYVLYIYVDGNIGKSRNCQSEGRRHH